MIRTLIPTRQPVSACRPISGERDEREFVVSAGILADAFGLTEDEVRRNMREATITSSAEVGVVADAGRWRLTFYYRDRACRLVVDGNGRVLSRVDVQS